MRRVRPTRMIQRQPPSDWKERLLAALAEHADLDETLAALGLSRTELIIERVADPAFDAAYRSAWQRYRKPEAGTPPDWPDLFLEALRDGYKPREAASMAKVSLQRVARRRLEDPEFESRYRQAYIDFLLKNQARPYVPTLPQGRKRGKEALIRALKEGRYVTEARKIAGMSIGAVKRERAEDALFNERYIAAIRENRIKRRRENRIKRLNRSE
ncbi:MAG: hypothetical protein KatS3mg057_3191 [Herpetosiphonaceae bacterium]|nr:MAG: hypothetical protein KatS3mg057_3191 [Herpetosiphonaceae bacterium]